MYSKRLCPNKVSKQVVENLLVFPSFSPYYSFQYHLSNAHLVLVAQTKEAFRVNTTWRLWLHFKTFVYRTPWKKLTLPCFLHQTVKNSNISTFTREMKRNHLRTWEYSRWNKILGHHLPDTRKNAVHFSWACVYGVPAAAALRKDKTITHVCHTMLLLLSAITYGNFSHLCKNLFPPLC